jgi:hypothetical protein
MVIPRQKAQPLPPAGLSTSAGKEKCMSRFLLTIGAAIVALSLLVSGVALAACPVGKDEGDTWCDNGTPWKCERCGSEYCSIIQPGSCLKDDAPFNASDLSRLIKRVNAASPLRYAQEDEPPQTEQSDQSAGQDLENAAEDGQEAVEAPTDEDAKVEAGETFDTPHNADGD